MNDALSNEPTREREVPSEDCGRSMDPLIPNAPKAKEIRIQQLDHGYLVNVGCQQLAIESVDRMIANLKRYLSNPADVEKEWFSTRRID